MSCISDTEKFARRMFRICLVLAAGMALITLALVSWTRFWLKITQGRERKGRPDSARSYSRVAFFTTALLTVFDGIGLDTAAALLPIFLILLPLELIWRRFSCTYEPIRS